jgi:hypothetical protein
VWNVEVKRLAAELLLSLVFDKTNSYVVGSNPQYLEILRQAKKEHNEALGREVEGILIKVGKQTFEGGYSGDFEGGCVYPGGTPTSGTMEADLLQKLQKNEQMPTPTGSLDMPEARRRSSSLGERRMVRRTRSGEQQKMMTDSELPKLMISYCWAQQTEVKKVHAGLQKTGHSVWLDVYDMAESSAGLGILEAMSAAINEADIVLVCVSREYSQSANCRIEAEYGQKQNKKMVFVMMQVRLLLLPAAFLLLDTHFFSYCAPAGRFYQAHWLARHACRHEALVQLLRRDRQRAPYECDEAGQTGKDKTESSRKCGEPKGPPPVVTRGSTLSTERTRWALGGSHATARGGSSAQSAGLWCTCTMATSGAPPKKRKGPGAPRPGLPRCHVLWKAERQGGLPQIANRGVRRVPRSD